MPFLRRSATVAALNSHQGATYPVGRRPEKRSMRSMHLLRTASSCSGVMATGFSWEYPCRPISCPASATICICRGKVSMEWPGMNQVVRRPYLSNILSSRGLPISPAKRPRVMSQGESSPPYDPNQPATASTSMPMQHMISFFATGLPSTLSYVAPTHRRRRAFKIHDRFIARACTVNSCRSLLSERILALDLVANALEEVTPAHAHLHTVWCAGCERPLAGASISCHKHPAVTERAIGVAGEEPRVPLADSLATLIVAPLQLS